MRLSTAAAAALALSLAACAEDGLSSEDASELARERVAAATGVATEALQVSELFVGERDADLYVCGVVQGGRIAPRRFIAANDPQRIVMFERASEIGQQGAYDFSLEWSLTCGQGAEADV